MPHASQQTQGVLTQTECEIQVKETVHRTNLVVFGLLMGSARILRLSTELEEKPSWPLPVALLPEDLAPPLPHCPQHFHAVGELEGIVWKTGH